MMKIKIVFILTALFVSLASSAQTDLTNTGTLKLSGNTDTLYITGAFTNSSSASLTNNGHLFVKQNLSNDQASMTVGTGKLYLNGSSAQTVSGSQIFKTYDFVSNNSAGITLNNDLSVTGTHTFSAGLIATSATPNYLVYEAGSSYTGDGDSKHVNGWVKKYGSTDFIFPVGDATYERTIALINLSLSSEFNCKYITPTPNIYSLQGPIVSVDPNEYWDFKKVSGGTAQVALNWNNAKVHFPNWLVSDIRAAFYTGGLWTDAGGGGTATGTTTTTGAVTSSAQSTFVPFTFGSTSFPLPIKLVDFSAEKRTGYVLLKWTVDNEFNADHYEVERSSDATHFSTIGTQTALNLLYTHQYTLEDHNPFSGIVYYRLKSIDNDGKYSYSKIIAVADNSILGNGKIIVLNPAHSSITILNKTIQSGDFNYQLLNISGQLVQKGIINMQANGITVLPVNSITPAGTYMLDIRKGESLTRTKVLLQ